MATIQPAKMNWWYEAIIDWMITNPDRTKEQCARELDVTPQWIYTVTNTDLFKARLEDRRAQHSALISVGLIDKTSGITEMVLDQFAEKMVQQRGELSLPFLRDTADTLLQRLGYTGKRETPPVQAPTQTVAVQVNVLTPEALAEARHRMLTAGTLREEGPPAQARPVPTLQESEPEAPQLELKVEAAE